MSSIDTLAEQRLESILANPIGKRGKAFFVERPEGRRLAISDIHGCCETFYNLLDKVGLNPSDQLFIVGDCIDRGPYSRGVIDAVKKLLVDGYNIIPIRGNHEQICIDFADSQPRKLALFTERQNAKHLLKNGSKLHPAMERFFNAMPYYIETDNHFLVHAGFDTYAKKPLKSWHDMLWIRKFDYDFEELKGKRIIHGHVPQTFKRIADAVERDALVWPIDNGCVRSRHSGYGRLVCVDIDSGKIWKTKNSDTLPLD